MMRFLLLVILCACTSSIGTGRSVAVPAVTVPSGPQASCRFEGPWFGQVRVQGQPVFRAYNVPAVAELYGQQLRGHLEKGGWHIFGEADLSEDDVLRTRSASWVNEGVAFRQGSAARVMGSRPDAVEATFFSSAIPALEQMGTPSRTFSCDQLGFGNQHGSAQTDRVALSLPAETQRLEQPSNTTLSLAIRPGHPAFVIFAPLGYPRSFQDAGQAEVDGISYVHLIRETRGVLVVGWTPSAAVRAPDGATGGLGVMGGLRGQTTHTECATGESVEVYALLQGNWVSIGRLEEGTPFVALTNQTDGWVQLAPLAASSGLFLAEGVELRIRPFSTPECTNVAGPASGGLGSVLGLGGLGVTQAPVETFNFEVELQAVTGLSGVNAGDRCSLELNRMPGGLSGALEGNQVLLTSCRAVLTCGAHVLFGAQATNGYFDCRRQDGHYSGTDEHTSDQVGNDPAFTLEANGHVTAEDTTTSETPAYRIEGQIVP